MQPAAANWDGYARLSRRGEGLIVLFKNESGATNAEVKLPVFPDGEFTLRSAMNGHAVGHYSGAQLRQGVELPLPAGQVEILEIRK